MTSPGRNLEALRVDVRVPGRWLVEGLSISVTPGEFIVILGQNGAGKTLTLLTLAGLRAPDGGEMRLDGTPLSGWPRKRLARNVAMMPQDSEDPFPATVFDTVLIGRHPHIGAFQMESDEDRAIATRSLEAVALDALRSRDVTTLSGGERRRLAIAQVLTQSPRYYLLDEPLNHLDPQHQLEALALFRQMADDGAAVVATLHDVNLAARYADGALLLDGNGAWQLGRTDEVLTSSSLGRLYGVDMQTVDWRGKTLFVPAGRLRGSTDR